MIASKIEPRLERELEAVEAAGDARPIPVIVEHANGALSILSELGVRNVRELPLVRAVSADMTPTQVRAVAAQPEVTLVRYDGPEYVLAKD